MSTASNNSLERLIAQANSARSAGVFETTQVDVSSLVAVPVSSRLIRFYERALVGLPVAACLGVVVGITSMMGGSGGQSGSLLSGGDLAVNTHGFNDVILSGGSVELYSFESVTQCFAGPGAVISEECGFADLDSDGDVDLADLGSYQQQFAMSN